MRNHLSLKALFIKNASLSLLLVFIAQAFIAVSCNQTLKSTGDNPELGAIFQQYYNERMRLLPIEGTLNGDSTCNGKLYPDFTDGYKVTLKQLYTKYSKEIQKFDLDKLNENDRLSYRIFRWEMDTYLEGLEMEYVPGFNGLDHRYMPVDLFNGIPKILGQFGGGDGLQPFKTVGDYERWESRAEAIPAWIDSAIVYFRKGCNKDYVLPATLVKKMIPQMEALAETDPLKNSFYGPVKTFPANFSDNDKIRFKGEYQKLIKEILSPSYKKFSSFLEKEYLPYSRTTSGLSSLPDGEAKYRFLIKYYTTTELTPEEIPIMGKTETERIHKQIDSVLFSIHFNGDLKALINFLNTDPKFKPYKTANEILDAYRSILTRIEPNLKKMFGHFPRTKFEIRQTETFMAATSGAELIQGTPDGKRPTIFYIPIIDPLNYNISSMEDLFLHEAIPGHHYEMSFQVENDKIPAFRRFNYITAYSEGWALYAESLGKELGVYTDPYQLLGELNNELFRALRLIIDINIHLHGMTREEAVKFLTDNMFIDRKEQYQK